LIPLKKATEVTENTEIFSGNSASLRLCARLFLEESVLDDGIRRRILQTGGVEGGGDNGLGGGLNLLKMSRAFEAFGVDFVNFFGARRPCRKPPIFRHYL
jgi:hypothetical protein